MKNENNVFDRIYIEILHLMYRKALSYGLFFFGICTLLSLPSIIASTLHENTTLLLPTKSVKLLHGSYFKNHNE